MNVSNNSLSNYFKTFKIERYQNIDTNDLKLKKIAANAGLGIMRVAAATLTLSISEWGIAAHAKPINAILDQSFQPLHKKIGGIFQTLIGRPPEIKDLLKPTSEQLLKTLQSGDLLVKAEADGRLSPPTEFENHKGHVFNAYGFLPTLRADLKNPSKRANERMIRILDQMKAHHNSDRLIKRDAQNPEQDAVVERPREYYEEKAKNNNKETSEKTSCTLFPPDCNMRLYGEKSLDRCTFVLCMDLNECTVRDEKDIYGIVQVQPLKVVNHMEKVVQHDLYMKVQCLIIKKRCNMPLKNCLIFL